ASLWPGNASFVKHWLGPSCYGGSALDLALAANLMLYAWVQPNRIVLQAAKVVRPVTVCRIIEGVVNLTLSILLARRFGLVGVALGTTAASVLLSIWSLPLLTARVPRHPAG